MSSNETSKRDLLKQIEEERQLVRIHEAELTLLRSSKKRRRIDDNLFPHKQKGLYESERNNGNYEESTRTSGDHDWLETLDSLHANICMNPDNETIKLDKRWHDNPEMYRLLPLIGGIAFTACLLLPRQFTNSNETSNGESLLDEEKPNTFTKRVKRVYELKGRVSATNATRVNFSVFVTIEFTSKDQKKGSGKVLSTVEPKGSNNERARIIDLKPILQDYNDTSGRGSKSRFLIDELDELSKSTSKSCNLPHFFQQLVSYCRFDSYRSQTIEVWQQQIKQGNPTSIRDAGNNNIRLGLTRVNSHLLDIRIEKQDIQMLSTETNRNKKGSDDTSGVSRDDKQMCHKAKNAPVKILMSLQISWRWKFTWFNRGHENLKVVNCTVSPEVLSVESSSEATCLKGSWISQVLDEKGLQDLLTCTNGNCKDSLQIIIQAFLQAK